MNVLALISGGKDSIFNIHKCIQHGHQIVALGNLYYLDQNTAQEGFQIDSYMYQTVGTNLTAAIAECLGKPLYRQIITGKPKIVNLQYEGTDNEKQGDEVEDLCQLIKKARNQHPHINAISTGAIFSTYQKARVEQICKRFDMHSLAYLWHREQSQLLQQMINFPLNAIIIKVASYGLTKAHLGKSIAELQQLFVKLKHQCGMNVCGEGGEFQSLVLDCPLFDKAIVINSSDVVEVQANEIAPVAYLRIKQFQVLDK